MQTLFTTTTIVILAMLYVAELIARRQADYRANLLQEYLEDAISTELDQYEDNQRQAAALVAAIDECNAANVRAARAASSIQAMPAMALRSTGPQPQRLLVELGPFYAN